MMTERCKDDDNMMDEIEMLLGEIPRVTSNYQCNSIGHNVFISDDHHGNGSGNGNGKFVMKSGCGVFDDNLLGRCRYYKYGNGSSPVSGLSLQSGGSSGSLVSGENGSITPPLVEEVWPRLKYGKFGRPHLSQMEELESSMNFGFWLGSRRGDSVDELGLSKRMNKMGIGGEVDDLFGYNGFRVLDQPDYGRRQADVDEFVSLGGLNKGSLGFEGFRPTNSRSMLRTHGEMHPTLFNSQQSSRVASLLEPPLAPCHPDIGFSQQNYQFRPPNVPWHNPMEWHNDYYNAESSSRNVIPSFRRPPAGNDACYARQNGVIFNQENYMFNRTNFPLGDHTRRRFTIYPAMHYKVQDWRARQSLNTVRPRGNFEALTTEDSVILQGECSNYKISKCLNCPKGQTKVYGHGIAPGKRLEKRSQVKGQTKNAIDVESGLSAGICNLSLVPFRYNSLSEAQGYIYPLAKDQNGCRFLQKMFDDGAPEDVQQIFMETVDHVVELAMDPFGNYLIQKLLDVCSEEQKIQILLSVTKKPGDLVKISLNSHGTRVVQKLIETLKVEQQILRLISALEPGFLDLIKDPNGNHVVMHCLHCFSTEYKRFIFDAAAKHCVEVATHQHGCCALQQCISYSTGRYRENLIAEISANGLLLAQDRYGNYVVQFVLDLKNPSAISNLIAQFEGNYVHLSTQKHSSHVVQRCLATLEAENCSRVIHELLSTAYFEQLLQDPFANYVIKTALEVSQGPLRNMLIEAIEPHGAVLRNSPYSKKICSLLWKK